MSLKNIKTNFIFAVKQTNQTIFVKMKSDVIIIGGGIVGLATAYTLLQNNTLLHLTLLEKESHEAVHQTGNNSGVIHSGIYYKPGSLKALNCIEGYHMLINFCKQEQIPFDLCGKIIVATKSAEIPALETLYQRGIQNGLSGLRYLNAEEIKSYEPNCIGIKGIFVPQTGIVDYKLVSLKLKEKILEFAHAKIEFNAKVIGIYQDETSATILTENKNEYVGNLIVNCAGLYCDKIAELAGEKLNLKIIPFRGEYFSLKHEKSGLVKNLIYPVPDANFPFLGVHFTRRISGEIEAGPNAVFAFKREGYKKTDFNWSEFWESIFWRGFRKVAMKYYKTGLGEYYRSFSKKAFTKALQGLVPLVHIDDLEPAGAGVRAQACDKDGGLIDDFYIQESNLFVHVLNAPSPAATSSLSIGKHIASIIEKKLTK
jgi:(S)-2-hydroxyglutarate dehydrogenase